MGQIKSDDIVLYAYVNSIRKTTITQKSEWFSSSAKRKTLTKIWKKILNSFSIRPTKHWLLLS